MSNTWPECPDYAHFTGYFIKYKHFQDLVLAIWPAIKNSFGIHAQVGYMTYVGGYDQWRGDLPEDVPRRIPQLKVLPPPGMDNIVGDDTLMFIETNWEDAPPFPDDEDVKDVPYICADEESLEETQADKTCLDELIALMQQRNGFTVDRTQLRFACIRDKHPYRDQYYDIWY